MISLEGLFRYRNVAEIEGWFSRRLRCAEGSKRGLFRCLGAKVAETEAFEGSDKRTKASIS